ncbi:uncharacterized protein LOC141602045 [Silene latifolia]|uniref:uncharacterized protein LOC141602045 n=1 Tax=Silene latifolia TaxID=37657 RepID=UPI003D776451
MEPPNINTDDFIYWKYTLDGHYIVCSAYKALTSEQVKIDANVPMQFWRHLWKLRLHPCCKVFIWKLMHNALPTKDLLIKKGLQLPSYCVLCNRYPETADHLFRHCETTQRIWRSGELGLRASINQQIALQKWMSDFVIYFLKNDRGSSQYCTTMFCSTLWAIWLARNDMEFLRSMLLHTKFLIEVRSLHMNNCVYSKNEKTHKQISDNGLRGKFTDYEGHRIQVAAMQGKHYGITGIAWFSENTTEIQGKTIKSSSPIHALSMSLLMAMQWALQHNYLEASFLIPSQQLIEALNHYNNIPVHICNTIDKIRESSYRFHKCCFHLCSSLDVRIAHKLANTCSKCNLHD